MKIDPDEFADAVYRCRACDAARANFEGDTASFAAVVSPGVRLARGFGTAHDIHADRRCRAAGLRPLEIDL